MILKQILPRFIYLKIEKFIFSIYIAKILIGSNQFSKGMRFSIAPYIEFGRESYKDHVNQTFIKSNNSSGGILHYLLDLAINFEPAFSSDYLLVSEPTGTGRIIEKYIASNYKLNRSCFELETLLDVKWNLDQHDYDLCKVDSTKNVSQKFDVVITQALIEHVFDPVQVLKNLISTLKIDSDATNSGVLVVHTNNVLMPLHRYPIDTLRYNKDWFISVESYLPLTLLHFSLKGHHMFAVYRVNSNQSNLNVDSFG